MANNQQLSLKHLSFTYQHAERPVLNNITVSAPINHIIGIIGNHHAGKTTLCRILAGLIPNIMAGRLLGDCRLGQLSPTENWSAYNQLTGLVLQDPSSQLSGLAETVTDEISFDLLNHGVAEADCRKRVTEVASQLQLTMQLSQSPASLSGGQLQRLAIATAIVTHPALLILDDPTSAMDPQGRTDFFNWLETVQNTTVIIVSNEIDDLCEVANFLWLLKDGLLVSQGTPLEVINQLNPEWQIEPPKIYQLAKLMHWSLPADPHLIPVNIAQLRRCVHDHDSDRSFELPIPYR